MSGVGEASAIFGLITGSIDAIKLAIKSYRAADQNASGWIQEVAYQLPYIQELLEKARDTKDEHDGIWRTVAKEVGSCEEACRALQNIFDKAFSEEDAGKKHYVWLQLNLISKKRQVKQHMEVIHNTLVVIQEKVIGPLSITANDRLSITASIIAVLQATKEFISYLKETKDSPKELTKVHEEARSLVILLYELKDCVAGQDTHSPWLQTTSELASRNGPLDQYKEALGILVPKTTGRGLRKVGQVLSWKFSKEEVVALLSQIERIKSLVQVALELDHMFVAQLN